MHQFFEPAIASTRGWLRVFAVLVLVFIGIVIGQIPYAYYLTNFPSQPHEVLTLVLIILPFGAGLLALNVAVRWIHGQSPLTLITPFGRIDWSRLTRSFLFWFILVVLGELLLFAFHPQDYVWNFQARKWIPLAAVAVFLLPIQTSFEEILFRGYLLQQLAVGLNNRWLALLFTSALFAAMHLANPEVAAFGMITMMLYYVSVGILLGICTLLDRRLELALGLHAATNIYGATMVTFKESAIQTPAMFRLLHLDANLMTVIFLLSAVLFFTYFARRYQWRMSLHPSKVVPPRDEDDH